jgi:hypothetical protein
MSLIFGFYQICWEFKKSLKKWIKTSAIMEDKKKKERRVLLQIPPRMLGNCEGYPTMVKKYIIQKFLVFRKQMIQINKTNFLLQVIVHWNQGC